MSRKIEDLHPTLQAKCRAHIAACEEAGISLIITSTYRSPEEQAVLYAQGRTAPGKIVTKAKPGQSMHNYRLAYDVVPLRNGKPVWGTTGEDATLWQQVGALGVAQGLEWAGNWVKFKESAHFQWTNGLTLAELQAGKTP
jgi:peptidoglycan L-alanyl-D-glutamate endopeptidase CwlK